METGRRERRREEGWLQGERPLLGKRGRGASSELREGELGGCSVFPKVTTVAETVI